MRKQTFTILQTVILVGVFAFVSIGCASKSRSNSSGFQATWIDQATGAPVWVQQSEEWDNDLKSALSKTGFDQGGATETRGADGSLTYTVNAQGVSTSPELNNLERLLGIADRLAQGAASRYGVNMPPATNAPPGQIVLSADQFNQLLSRGTTGEVDGYGVPGERTVLQPQPGTLLRDTGQQISNTRDEDAAGVSSPDPVEPATPDPTAGFTDAQLRQLRELLGREDMAEGKTSGAVDPQPPAIPDVD